MPMSGPGTTRTFEHVRLPVALEGEADIRQAALHHLDRFAPYPLLYPWRCRVLPTAVAV